MLQRNITILLLISRPFPSNSGFTFEDHNLQLAAAHQPVPCIHPVWDPGSPTGLSLECLPRSHDGNSLERNPLHGVHWEKV